MGGGTAGPEPDEVMKKKLENFATTFIESIAARRHRNVEWAKTAVRESAAITAEKALELKVIDLMADDIPDLLKQLDGREVNGKSLHTASAEIQEVPMLLREKVFQMLWRPEVMFILMLIAIYGIIGELSNPGAILPGVVGAIALVLALYMASVLPVNIAGLALIVLAVGLFVTDLFAPTHGVLTAGGIISFFLGSLMLFDTAGPAFRLSLGLDHSCNAHYGRLLHLRCWCWVAGAISADQGREGKHGGENGDGTDAHQRSIRQGIRGRRVLERRQRGAGRRRQTRRNRRRAGADAGSETKNIGERVMEDLTEVPDTAGLGDPHS